MICNTAVSEIGSLVNVPGSGFEKLGRSAASNCVSFIDYLILCVLISTSITASFMDFHANGVQQYV